MQKRTLLFAGIALCLLGAAIGLYWYNKPRAGVDRASADFTLTATELFRAYQQNEQQADARYAGKVLDVSGVVENVEATAEGSSLLLSSGDPMGGVNCSLAKDSDKATLPQKGRPVRIKGRCTGFLMDVNLVDAVVVTP
ncbi:hypothetical protein V9K67_23700 [Paraflavisolibacter sp. H34]|uniref:OB-fold protein n=1 Tax=Huijunlia imazamoxiresistens TaxID=3127457 RepID=UPI003019597E